MASKGSADKAKEAPDEVGALVADGDSTTKVKDAPDEAGTVVADRNGQDERGWIITVTAKHDGFRRAGREWVGTTTVNTAEFTAEQLEMLVNEKNLVVVID